MQRRKKVENYTLGRVLGVGGFGRVMLGEDTKTKQPVAVKVIDKALVKQNKLEEYVKREMSMLAQIDHPHIVKLVQTIEEKSAYYLVMELAPNGELFDKIVTARRFPEDVARRYFQQLIAAVEYCHKLNIVHRDLKAENLLLGPKDDLRVCDFGLSRYAAEEHAPDRHVVFMSMAGSTDYQAPEVIDCSTTGYAGFTCDVWSCGVILFFMLCGYLPFAAQTEDETRRRVKTGEYSRTCKYLSPAAADLIMHILVPDPKQRFTIPNIMQHPWFLRDLDERLFPGHKKSLADSIDGSPWNQPQSPTTAKPNRSHEEELALAFRSCNVDGTGVLTKVQMRDVLIKLNNGNAVPEEEVVALLTLFPNTSKDASPSAHGGVNEKDFIAGWKENPKALSEKLEPRRLINIFHYEVEREFLQGLRTAFDGLDIDHSGIVTLANVKGLPQLNLSEDESHELLTAMNAKTQQVTFEDFVHIITKSDLVKKHPVGKKLMHLAAVFTAQDFTGCKTYINIGFTVAGFRETIESQVLERGKNELDTLCSHQIDTGFLECTYNDELGRECKTGVQLVPTVPGYTKIFVYRIQGRTEAFHHWFRMLRTAFREEILQVEEDTEVSGESELL